MGVDMSRRSSSSDRSSLGPLRIRSDDNKSNSNRRSRSTDAKNARLSTVGRSTSGSRSSFGSQSGIPGTRKSMVQSQKFGQGSQGQKNRLSRSSIIGTRGSSIGLRGGGNIPRDPRPISDKSYQHKCIKNILQFLTDKGYPFNITQKVLQSPTTKEFLKVFEFIYSMLDENYKVGTKHEEEIPRIMKMLGYPFLISKSSMFTIGTPHTWPTMLAGLSYVVDLINYGINAMDQVDNLLFPSDDVGFGESFTEKQILYQYCQSAYSRFMEGYDTYETENEQLEKLLKQKYLGSAGGIDGLLEENAILEQELELLQQDTDKLKCLTQQRDVLLSDEERFVNYLNDLEVHKRQQDQQLLETEETCASLAIELEAERAKIVQMQSVYEAQEFSPDDVEKINMRRRELQRQIDEVNKQCEMEDKEIWSMEMALTKEMEQTDAKFQRYNKHARALKLIPISAENSGGIDYELKSSVGNVMGTEFASTIKPALLTLKTKCADAASAKESLLIKHREQVEQQTEALADRQHEVSLLESKYKRADDELECKKQMFQKELQHTQQELDEIQSGNIQLKNTPYMEQDLNIDIRDIDLKISQQEAEMERKVQAHAHFLQEAVTASVEHMEVCQKNLYGALDESEKLKQKVTEEAKRTLKLKK